VGLEHDISREFIAVPDSAKGQLLYKWPDRQIRRWTKAIVDVDELAVFVSQGRVVGTLPPGRHDIDATELPFLGDLIDKLTGSNAYDSELFFVSTHEFADLPFGGPVDAVRDPETHLVVQLRAYGEYSLRVTDPVALIRQLTGTVDLADPSAVEHWAAEQVLKAARTVVVGHVVNDGWPVLGLAARTHDIEAGTLPAANDALIAYGLQVSRLGNITVNLSEEDAEQLRNLARDTAYTSLAGSFGAYAQGEALLGAGRGMANGQGAGTEALAVAALGIGTGVLGNTGLLGGVAATASPQQPVAPAEPGQQTQAPAAPAPQAQAQSRFCAQCGHRLDPGARFCSACGHAIQATQAVQA
jgi:membrane protease subunit (stomatin/prohibitin family)